MSDIGADEPRPLIFRKPQFDYGPPQHRGKPGRPKGPLKFPNNLPHRDKFTELLVNMSPCPACIRHLKKRGLHRDHRRCLGQTVGQRAVVMCDCECRRMSTALVEYIRNTPMGLN